MAVTGASPVAFISEDATNHGTQYQIPLAVISISGAGVVDLSGWTETVSASDEKLAAAVVLNLYQQGLLAPK